MDATWHARPRGSATRAHAARCDDYFIFIIYISYSTYKSSDYRKIIIIPLNPSHIINPPPSFNLIRVGLSSIEFLNVQVTWLKVDRRIE